MSIDVEGSYTVFKYPKKSWLIFLIDLISNSLSINRRVLNRNILVAGSLRTRFTTEIEEARSGRQF